MKKVLGICKIYGIITLGALIAALGVSLFLTPVHMVAGGLSGIGIIVNSITGFPVGTFMLILNIPLFLVGFKSLGTSFLLRSIYGALMFSLLTDATALLPQITDNLMLCALFGGGLLGIGMGIIFLLGGTTGGTDILAQLIHKPFRFLDVGKWCTVLDGIIILASAFLFQNWEACLYGIIAAIVNGILVDMMIQGANFAKVVYVISPKAEAIAADVMNTLERGATALYCKKMYSGTDGLMLMCVIKNREIPRFECIALSHDENAFIIFTGARSVSGEGFKIYPIN